MPITYDTSLASTTFVVAGDSNFVIKATPGFLKHINVINTNAALRYLQVHDKATAPSDATTLKYSIPIPAAVGGVPGIRSVGADELGNMGLYCAAGIAIMISTAYATFSAATDAEHSSSGMYA